MSSGPALPLLRRLPELDPIVNLQKESSLPPEPDCARLSDVLALVEPRLGPALLDAPGRAALHSVARCIPALSSTFWGLEIRLGDPKPRADFLWEVRQGRRTGVPVLAGRHPRDPAADIAGALRNRSRFWRELGRFAGDWLDSPDWLRRLGNIWLEVDTASAAGAKLDASLDRPNLFWGPNGRVKGSDRDVLGHLGALGRRFYGLEPDQDRIHAVARALPPQGIAFQMGVMGARALPVVRLCVKIPDVGMRERWLDAIGWPGDRAALRDVLARLEPLSGEIALNVDILPDRVGETLGLEVYSAERTLSMDTWQPLHDELLARRLARADKLAALGDFPSFQRFRQLGAWRRTPPVGFPILATNLHHLKLNFVGDGVREAKAYLGVFRPLFDYSRDPFGAVEGADGWQ